MNNQQILKILQCPVEWEPHITDTNVVDCLKYLWALTIRKYEVDQESSLFTGVNGNFNAELDDSFNEDDRRRFRFNYPIWHKEAVKEYLQDYGMFSKIDCCGPNVYPKHYAPVDSTDDDICRRSKVKGIGILHPSFDIDRQKQLFWMALSDMFDTYVIFDYELDEWQATENRFKTLFANGHLRLFVMNCEAYIFGAVGGALTQCCCVDIDLSTPQYHIYPVADSEFESANYSVVLDEGPYL